MRVLELEPMFAVEAKKRALIGNAKGGKNTKSEVISPQTKRAPQARDLAAEVVSASTGTSGTTLFLSEYRH
jgi:hypothetical protein